MGISSKTERDAYIRADLLAAGVGGGWRPQYRLTNRIAYFLWLLRRAEYFANCRADPLGRAIGKIMRLRLMLLGERLGYEIPPNVFGPGLALVHKGTVVVNAGARVGRNARLGSDITIGDSRGGVPTIGDQVWVAPGARILGGITLGDRVAVAANAVVLSDVPSDTTVAGIPARAIRTKPVQHMLTDQGL